MTLEKSIFYLGDGYTVPENHGQSTAERERVAFQVVILIL